MKLWKRLLLGISSIGLGIFSTWYTKDLAGAVLGIPLGITCIKGNIFPKDEDYIN